MEDGWMGEWQRPEDIEGLRPGTMCLVYAPKHSDYIAHGVVEAQGKVRLAYAVIDEFKRVPLADVAFLRCHDIQPPFEDRFFEAKEAL